jgi:hypothetical protein
MALAYNGSTNNFSTSQYCKSDTPSVEAILQIFDFWLAFAA